MNVWRFCVLAALTLGAYSFILSAPFKTLDDQASIVNNPAIQRPAQWKALFTEGYFKDHSYYRPLVNVSYMLEYKSVGLNPFFYNLDNVLIHLFNAVLVWMLVAVLTDTQIGFWTALLFAIHPIQWEAVANISGRAILLSTCFSLMALLLYFKQRHIAAMMAFVAALFCKESAVILPGILALHAFLYHKRMRWVYAWAAVLAGYGVLRHYLGMTELFRWQNAQEHVLGVMSFFRSVLTDLRLFILPLDLHFDRSYRIFATFKDPVLWGGLAAWLAAAGGMFIFRQKISQRWYLSAGWFVLALFPVSQVISPIGVQPGRISTAEHFLYMACVPVFMLAVDVILRYKTDMVKWIAIAVIGFFVLITIEQNIYAQNELAMVERSLRIQPHNARLHSTAGLIYALSGKFKEAETHFRQAVAENPSSARYRISLGKSLCDQGRISECLAVYDQIHDAGGLNDILQNNKKAALRLLKQQ